MEKPPVPKPKSKVDKAKELEDFMYKQGLTTYQVRELLQIIEFARQEGL